MVEYKPFDFKTVMDRVITNSKGDIIFEQNKPAYVIDESSIKEIQKVIAELKLQTTKLQEQVDNQVIVIGNQDTQIANQQTTIDNQVLSMTVRDLILESVEMINLKHPVKMFGISTNEKPIGNQNGQLFYEVDTAVTYVNYNDVWYVDGEPNEIVPDPEPEPDPEP